MTADSSPTAARKPRRRWLQFGLRTLLLLMVPVACLSAWGGHEYQKGRRQKAAIAWMEQNGWIYFEDRGEPTWQQKVFGDWYPGRVTHVDLSGLRDAGIERLAPLTEIEAMLLRETDLDTRDIATLANFKSLKFVDVSDCYLDEKLLEELREARPDILIWQRPGEIRRDEPYSFSDGSVLEPAGTKVVKEAGSPVSYHVSFLYPLILPVEDGVMVEEENRLVRYSAAHEEQWSVPLDLSLYILSVRSMEMPDGDLVVYRYDFRLGSGGDLVRIDPVTGAVRWQSVCAPITGHENDPVPSDPLHESRVDFLARNDETLAVICDGFDGVYVELIDAHSGDQVKRWDFSNHYFVCLYP